MDEPSGLERVWERHLRPQPEPKQGLSVARIVDAAIEVADADGIGAVSMSRVAASLGFTTMSLYRHVRSKEELLLLMQDAAVGSPPDQVAGEGWRAGLERWAWSILRSFRLHPWFLQTIPMMGAPATPNQLAWLEVGLRALGDTALTEGEKMTTILLVDSHVLGDLLYAATGDASEGTGAGYAATLFRMLDPQRFPALLRAAKGGAFDDSEDPAAVRDADFAFGLARILDGVERLLERRAAD
jgi:AcrR family transcriptional regulator